MLTLSNRKETERDDKGKEEDRNTKEGKKGNKRRGTEVRNNAITVRASHFEDKYYVCPLVFTLPHSTPKYTWHWEVLGKVNDQRSPYLAA
jgi:hypothetical protein